MYKTNFRILLKVLKAFLLNKELAKKPGAPKKPERVYSTDFYSGLGHDEQDFKLTASQTINIATANLRQAKKDVVNTQGKAIDARELTTDSGFKTRNSASYGDIPLPQVSYFTGLNFIGYQLCTFMMQQWLIYAACERPAQDAMRKGYEISVNSGEKIDLEILDEIRNYDKEFMVNKNCEEFETFLRGFGIRICLFTVESTDPQYYEKPFNIDGVMPGAYRGITQIDPYWISPELDARSAADPTYQYFYEPTWWQVNGRRIHRSHLVIGRHAVVADMLKPTYLYGGISLCQQIFDRVFASEITANEAPKLALAKRMKVIAADLNAAVANPGLFQKKVELSNSMQSNWGTMFVNRGDVVQQFDTTLSDFDAVIMTQFQLVAAAARTPSTKLLGIQPKGFNTTGEYEEASYHETLESMQTHHFQPLIERHHMLIVKSYIEPKHGVSPTIEIKWNPLDAMTAKEQAEVNKIKADTAAVNIQSGITDQTEERTRLIQDPDSDYSGLEEKDVNPTEEDPFDQPLEVSSDPENYGI